MSDNHLRIDRRETLALTAGATALALAPAATLTMPARAAVPVASGLRRGRNQPFDLDWRFHRGMGDGLEAVSFDDSNWRKIDLPHDWSIEDLPGGATGPFVKTAEGGTATGFTVGGEGWIIHKPLTVSASRASPGAG